MISEENQSWWISVKPIHSFSRRRRSARVSPANSSSGLTVSGRAANRPYRLIPSLTRKESSPMRRSYPRGSAGERRPGGTAAGHRGRPDPDPGSAVSGAAPRLQPEVVEPPDLIVVLHYLGEPADNDGPARMGSRVVVVGLEPDQVLAADARSEEHTS